MGRYERGDRFWKIERDGLALEVTEGAIGTDGVTTREELPSPEIARTREKVLTNRQLREGWRFTTRAPAPVAHEWKLDEREPAIEAALAADPDDLDQYRVYGDWLQSRGDPRGELIALQAAGQTARANEHLVKHSGYLLGPFASLHGTNALGWRSGFLERVELGSDEGRAGLVDQLAQGLAHPSARFLRALYVRAGYVQPADSATVLELIVRLAPTTLRSLRINTFGDGEHDFDPICQKFTQLEELCIRAKVIVMPDSFDLRSLVRLQLFGVITPASTIRTVLAAPLPRLQKLELWLQRSGVVLDDLTPIWDRKLAHLRLRHPLFPGPICERIATGAIAEHLEVLDLAPAELTEADAKILLDHGQRFHKLQELWIAQTSAQLVQLEGIAGAIIKVEPASAAMGSPWFERS